MEKADAPAQPGGNYSKVVDPGLLPALKAQRDPKTGQLKDEPAFIKHRMDLFDKLFAEQQARYEAKEKVPIKITLPDGAVKEGKAWETTPLDIATGISHGLAQACVAAKVNGKVWDMTRKLEEDCTLALLKFDDKEGRETYWHSSAHILGECMERYFGGSLCYGPDIEDGFYYDMWMGDRTVSSEADMPKLEKLYQQMMKEKQPFQRLEVTREQLLEMFKHNPFKQRLIQERGIGDTTVYRCGNLIDMCRGPHLPHTGKAKAISLYKTSSTYWEGNADQESLQRVYGITFPDKKKLAEWVHIQVNQYFSQANVNLFIRKRPRNVITEKLVPSKNFGCSIPSPPARVSGYHAVQLFTIVFKVSSEKSTENAVSKRLSLQISSTLSSGKHPVRSFVLFSCNFSRLSLIDISNLISRSLAALC